MPVRPRVSVVIRTYNRAEYLREAIESVLGQTFRNFELIVADDGSTDSTPELLDRYRGRLTPVFLGRTANPARVFNAGVLAASGELVAFLDSDDTWLPTKLERQVALLDANERFGFSYGNVRLLYPDGTQPPPLALDEIVAKSALRAMVRNMCVHTSTLVMRRCWFDRVGSFDEDRLTCEEFFFLLRLARATDGVCVPEPVSVVRRHDSQLSLERGLSTYSAAIEALEELLQEGDLPWVVRFEAHRSIARYHTHLARVLTDAGPAPSARAHLLRALARYPWHLPAWRQLAG